MLLDPRRTWGDGPAYDAQAKKLVQMFSDNFEQYIDKVDAQMELQARASGLDRGRADG